MEPSAAVHCPDDTVNVNPKGNQMALFFPGKSKCPICNTVVGANEEHVATSHFISDGSDPLWSYSDAALHKACFLQWQHRQEFVAKFNALAGTINFGNDTYHEMQPDGAILSKKRR
jgi:hypothetical protein